MSMNLDKSLDDILATQRRSSTKRRSSRRTVGNRPAPAAPAGGIQKKSQPARNATKSAPVKGAGLVGESKIMVSNLPKDVSEAQIKEYFQSSVGQVKKVELSYGPGGQSRGIAHVIFHHADGATKAFQSLNGLLIDNRPVKVEVIVANADLIPQPKSLGQRITQPKAQPKSAAAVKNNGAAGKGAAGKGPKKGPKKGKSGRPARKTAEELDSEMTDYFASTTTADAGTAAAASGGDAPMEDEIL